MAWNIEGMYYENCSCDAVCPCTWSNMNRAATNDDCRVALLFEVEKGSVDDVDVAGTTCVVIMQTPAQMLEGNFKVGLIIGTEASDEQADKLTQVFSGAVGGPMAGFSPLIADFVGVERMAVSVAHDGAKHHITVGDALDISLTKELTPDGDPVQLTGIVVHPAGPTLDVAVADRVTNSAFGIDWSGDGLSGFSNPFAWAA
jgi:hypothetical protein